MLLSGACAKCSLLGYRNRCLCRRLQYANAQLAYVRLFSLLQNTTTFLFIFELYILHRFIFEFITLLGQYLACEHWRKESRHLKNQFLLLS